MLSHTMHASYTNLTITEFEESARMKSHVSQGIGPYRKTG